ncbi:target of rapamycin complex subunit lst8 isoform X2 [Cylas formicarius]|uniref:target of rapamycin complex subunit lst8 isoform X2 n=1 Tax=Cylas formicarius TaxID=197179 RepID=UPI002958A45E|nr:target of rapamycin complex subunit lst8 isoform X2 [Cylas formicarius]
MPTENSDVEQIILATAGYDHTIKLWQTHTGICHRTLQHAESQVNALEITPDKKILAAASYQHIYMYDLQTSNPNAIVNYEGTSKNVTCIGFQEDGKWMFSGGEDCSARIWDLRLGTIQCPKMFKRDQNGIIYRWDLRTDQHEQFMPENDALILSIDISPDMSQMACVNNKGRAYIWNIGSTNVDSPTMLKPKHKFYAHKRYALKCKYSPDSSFLITTSADQSARIWDTVGFDLSQELKGDNQRWVWDAAWSTDGQYVFTASSDNIAKLWNVKAGTVEKEYAGHQKAITAMAFRDAAI